ncbi:DUF3515 domain-containing protein [Nocardioides agariphilus]|uniref:DUF3515 domain-containing protein n=1 Tax=Nocardioides agariphilus TaxID=433664 RepID=A0A930YIZ0_9ACTN|nr:DUF3515 domain-containing protein [Nocardioides agariphilus]
MLTACADEPVTLESPVLDEADTATCDAFLDALPRRLDGEEKRKVNPAAALGRAWGDPPIIVRCGADVPSSFDQTPACQVVGGVGWFATEDRSGDQVFTAVDHFPIVSVQVPGDESDRTDDVLADLAAPIEGHLEPIDACD